jgi:hypothetical protein
MSGPDSERVREIFHQSARLGLIRGFPTLEALLVAAHPLGLLPSAREWIEQQPIPQPAGADYILAVAPGVEETELTVGSCCVFGGALATDPPGRYVVFLMGMPMEFIKIFLDDWEAGSEAVARHLGGQA